MQTLTDAGQIQPGDTIHCEFKGKPKKYRAKEVLNAGTDKEEILINKKKNLYFITSMAIDGTSWAKNVRFISTKQREVTTQMSKAPDHTDLRLINDWEELKTVEPSETHYLQIEDGCGWIMNKSTGRYDEYLSTHTFYGKEFQLSGKTLQKYGFNIELANWDA